MYRNREFLNLNIIIPVKQDGKCITWEMAIENLI